MLHAIAHVPAAFEQFPSLFRVLVPSSRFDHVDGCPAAALAGNAFLSCPLVLQSVSQECQSGCNPTTPRCVWVRYLEVLHLDPMCSKYSRHVLVG